MKRLLLTLAFTLTLLLSPQLAQAAHEWQVSMSDPTVTNQTRNFNIDYVALSTDKSDEITVNLYENGAVIDSQTTTAGGDSGTFNVTVPSDGSYTYGLAASSGADGSSKSTTNKIVTVVTPVEGGPSEVTSTDAPNGSGSGENTGTNGGADGEVEGEETGDGQVGDGEGASTDENADEEDSDSDSTETALYALAIIVLGALAYYLYAMYRAKKAEEE